MKLGTLVASFIYIVNVVAFNDEQLTRVAFGMLQKSVSYPYYVEEGPHKNWYKYWSGPNFKNNAELLRFELEGTYDLHANGSVIVGHKKYSDKLVFNDELATEIFGDVNQRTEIFANGGINFGEHKYSDSELLEFFKLVLIENGLQP